MMINFYNLNTKRCWQREITYLESESNTYTYIGQHHNDNQIRAQYRSFFLSSQRNVYIR